MTDKGGGGRPMTYVRPQRAYQCLAIAILERAIKDVSDMHRRGRVGNRYEYDTLFTEINELLASEYFDDLCHLAQLEVTLVKNILIKEMRNEYSNQVGNYLEAHQS